MYYVHCLNNISKYGTDQLPDSYQLTDNIDEATGILVRSAAMHEMEFSENLLAIARAGAGVNNIPLDRCAEEGIVVFNAPGANANAVKELVICSLFLGSRDIVDGISWVRDNADDENISKSVEKAKKQFAGREITGKKLGVIGLGAIGARVANAALALGMDVYGYDPYVSVGAAWRIDPEVKHVTDLDEIFATCNYITLHVPALESTKGMVDAHAVDLMQEGTVLLNFSRDTLVNTEAVVAGVESGKIHRYITDFAIPGIVHTPGIIVVPHLGASTAEAEDNCAAMAAAELVDYVDNGNIRNSVNYPALNLGTPAAHRVAILHGADEGAGDALVAACADAGLSVANSASAQRGNSGYTLIDVAEEVSDAAAEKLGSIDGVRRVRVIA